MAIIALDQKIKHVLQTWRERKYKGASPVTKRLLEFWFKEEHILPDGSRFEFWRCQREGVEALSISMRFADTRASMTLRGVLA